MKKLILKILISALLSSIFTAIIYPERFFFILFGTVVAALILLGDILCGLVDLIISKFNVQHFILRFMIFLLIGNAYPILSLQGMDIITIVVGTLIGVCYSIVDYIMNKKFTGI